MSMAWPTKEQPLGGKPSKCTRKQGKNQGKQQIEYAPPPSPHSQTPGSASKVERTVNSTTVWKQEDDCMQSPSPATVELKTDTIRPGVSQPWCLSHVPKERRKTFETKEQNVTKKSKQKKKDKRGEKKYNKWRKKKKSLHKTKPSIHPGRTCRKLRPAP